MIGLTSCDQNLWKKKGELNIYQPSILSLEKGKSIQTKDGIYTPETDEVWHSDKRFRILERGLYNK
jgi:hypothetical protein